MFGLSRALPWLPCPCHTAGSNVWSNKDMFGRDLEILSKSCALGKKGSSNKGTLLTTYKAAGFLRFPLQTLSGVDFTLASWVSKHGRES